MSFSTKPDGQEGDSQLIHANTVYHFNTAVDSPECLQLLVLLAHHRSATPFVNQEDTKKSTLDYVDYKRLAGYKTWPDFFDLEEDTTSGLVAVKERKEVEDDTLYTFMLGDGEHAIDYNGSPFIVKVCPLIGGRKLLCHNSYSEIEHGKEVTLHGVRDLEQMKELLNAASKHICEVIRSKRKPQQYLFDAKSQSLVRMHNICVRSKESLFLREGEREKLFDLVEGFLNGKDDYHRFNVPYKLNILLYGLPGSGTTSTISALASHFKTNLAIVPFSQHLNDDSLPSALHKARTFGCRIVALEDVDSVFTNNTKSPLTLSGLLNSMDGLVRSEGLVMILTANSLRHIREPVLRAARVDAAMAFTHADEYQTRCVFNHYFPMLTKMEVNKEVAWHQLWTALAPIQYSVAGLQQFFFRSLHETRLPVERFREIAKGVTDINEDLASLYL